MRGDTADAEVYLADVPFIRLRGVSADTLRAGGAHVYGEVVSGAQQMLDVVESEYDLQIDLRRYAVTVKGRSVRLTPARCSSTPCSRSSPAAEWTGARQRSTTSPSNTSRSRSP